MWWPKGTIPVAGAGESASARRVDQGIYWTKEPNQVWEP
jgi:hypothetical protein